MKKILTLLLVIFCACTIQAQDDVTTFLGIPVDGFKPQMIQKLKGKGFLQVQGQDALEGEFNGMNVNVFVVTNNNKVYRIMLCDKNTQDEANIKIRFNKLVSQFENNPRYITTSDFSLSDSEDISYEIPSGLIEKLLANPYARDRTKHPDMHLIYVDEICG